MKAIPPGREPVILRVTVLLMEITSPSLIVMGIHLERVLRSAIHRMFLIPWKWVQKVQNNSQKVLLMDRLPEIPRVQVPEIPTIFHSARHWGAA